MTGLGPPLPSPVDPHVGVIVCNTRAVPHPTPACPQATAARPYGLHRPIISLLLTQTTRQSPSHITPVLPCPLVSLWLPPSHRFEDHLGVRRPNARRTCTFVFPCCVGKGLSVLLTISAYQRRTLLKMPPQGAAVTGGCQRSRFTG